MVYRCGNRKYPREGLLPLMFHIISRFEVMNLSFINFSKAPATSFVREGKGSKEKNWMSFVRNSWGPTAVRLGDRDLPSLNVEKFQAPTNLNKFEDKLPYSL